MKHKIGVDFSYVTEDSVTGIRKYGEEIVQELIRLNKEDEFVLFVDERVKDVFEKNYPSCKNVPLKYWFKNIKYVRRINIYKISKIPKKIKIKREKCDFIIYPYANRLAPIIKGDNKIVAIHDVIPLDEIENKKSFKYYRVKRENIKFMNESKNLVTISEYSKRRLMDINPNYKGKITVIPNSIKELVENNKDTSEITNSNKPYIFTINSFFKHKNQITVVKAFNKIKDKIPHNLILVGRPELLSGKSGYNEIQEFIEKNNLKERVKVLSYISDEDRNALFYNADLFVTTSLLEGFGRTPVEAALCRVPVISTMETSLPEVTMGEVYYYKNPTDYNELADKIIEVINNKPSKEKLKEIAKKFTDEYNEEKIAKKYIILMNEIMEGEQNAKN